MNIGINQAAQQPLLKSAPRSTLTSNNAPRTSDISKVNDTILTLSAFEVKCLMLQIAYMESDSNVSVISGDRLGQYHLSDYLLK